MGRIRIIAGELSGRRLRVPDVADVRPTSERAREALFSILGESVRGCRVLDLYAGSGALGLEALSRGASHVTFVENDRRVLPVLQDNLERVGDPLRLRLVAGRVERVLEGRLVGERFGLVLADPPYRDSEELLLRALVSGRFLEHGATLVLERPARTAELASLPQGLERVRMAKYGDSRLDFYGLRPA